MYYEYRRKKPCIETAIGDIIPCFETKDGNIRYEGDTITFVDGKPMTFKNITFRNLNFRGTIDGYKFINCKFENCNFWCKTQESIFTNCQLKDWHLGTITHCKFLSCYLDGIVDKHICIDYNEFDGVTGSIKYRDTTNIPSGNIFKNMTFDGFIELFQYGQGTCRMPKEYWNAEEKGKKIIIWGGEIFFENTTLSLNKLKELCSTTEIIVSAKRFNVKNKTSTYDGNLETVHFEEIANLCIYLEGMPEELKAVLIVSAFNTNQKGTTDYTIIDDGVNTSMGSTTRIHFYTEDKPSERGCLTIINDNEEIFKGKLPKIDVKFEDPKYNPCQRYCGKSNQVVVMTAKDLNGATIQPDENPLDPNNYAAPPCQIRRLTP